MSNNADQPLSSPRIHVARTYESPVDVQVVISDLLADRNISTHASDSAISGSERDDGAAETFLHPKHPTDLSLFDVLDPDGIRRSDIEVHWSRALELLKNIYEKQQPIVVYSDYDADGVTGGAIMWETLHKLGFKAIPYIPSRQEGYGFSKQGIDHVLQEFKPALIISVDHGIVAHEEIAYARSKGVPILVTDHHHQQNGEPEAAEAVFHTTAISGAGVAYFFAKELLGAMGATQQSEHVRFMMRADYLGLAAIGTIADMIPLVGPARSLARYGLAALSTTSRPGIRHLLHESGVPPRQSVTAYHVGFMIAPRINAFGRLEHAMDALRLLCTFSDDKASQLAKRAGDVNTQRQQLVTEALKEAHAQVQPDDKLIILTSQSWEEGIIGLIAGKIMQSYYRPVIAMTRSEGFAKASVRSIDGVHITHFLSDLKHHLVDMGGHEAAAGFTISVENMDAFTEEARAKARKEITDETLVRKLRVDISMPIDMATLNLARALDELAPFGIGFPEPIFMSTIIIDDVAPMGKTGTHLKIHARSSGRIHAEPLDLLYFNAPRTMHTLEYGQELAIAYTLGVNTWNGRQSAQGVIKEVI